jgi:hypothetical protein
VASYLTGCGTSISPEQIHLTRCRGETYLLLDGLCGPEGLAPSPSEPFLEPIATAASVPVRRYALRYDG